ncbi:MAG: hypothetical protein JF590_05335 [Gemmatimonadetes bacterium]|nr:hypothetical protein [Gemmatimonadota bacterium]
MIDLSLLPDGGLSWLDASGPQSHLASSGWISSARQTVSCSTSGTW